MSTEHTPGGDDDLRRAVVDAVAEVSPSDRLAQIRRSTTAARHRRRRRLAVQGGALVAAAGVLALALVVRSGPEPGTAIDPAARPDGAPGAAAPDVAGTLTAVYLLGPGPTGPSAPEVSLYRYFAVAADPLDLLTAPPADPDYATLWAPGSLVGHDHVDGSPIDVVLGDESLTRRADDVSAAEARLALQQVVYTLQAYYGDRAPVRFLVGDEAAGEVLGIATPGPVDQDPPLEVLSHLSISDPAEGNSYDASFVARGVANGFEGTVSCRLLDTTGSPVWQDGTVVEDATLLDDGLAPWRLGVDLDEVTPGAYTLACTTDDPTDGAEGRGADVDTRSITVE